MDSLIAEALSFYAGNLQQDCLKVVRNDDGQDIPANKVIYDRGIKLGELNEKIKENNTLDDLELEAIQAMRDEFILQQHRAVLDAYGRSVYSLSELAKNARKLGAISARRFAGS
jgi:hypothetical protein